MQKKASLVCCIVSDTTRLSAALSSSPMCTCRFPCFQCQQLNKFLMCLHVSLLVFDCIFFSIAEDQWDTDAWNTLLADAEKKRISQSRDFFERFLKAFPSAVGSHIVLLLHVSIVLTLPLSALFDHPL